MAGVSAPASRVTLLLDFTAVLTAAVQTPEPGCLEVRRCPYSRETLVLTRALLAYPLDFGVADRSFD